DLAEGGAPRLDAVLHARRDLARFRPESRPLAGPSAFVGSAPQERSGKGGGKGGLGGLRTAPALPATVTTTAVPAHAVVSGAAIGMSATVAGPLAIEARRGSGMLR